MDTIDRERDDLLVQHDRAWTAPVWATIVQYTVSVVKMDDYYTLFAQLDGEPDAIAIGNPVTTRFVQRGEQKRPDSP